MKNKIKLNLGLFIIFLLIVSLVSAFGVTTSYWLPDKPLILYPGETREVSLVLQNMVGDKDLTLKAQITEGSEVAELVNPDTEYFVPFGSKDISVIVRVYIPEDVDLEEEYNVAVTFKEIIEQKGQMLEMSGSVGANIPVLIKSYSESTGKSPAMKNPSLLYALAIVIVLAAVIVFVTFKKKKSKNK
ncbi:MAG: hypothetical protein KJ906_03415 [Nanoarchaeota archaeon]|nr:hypothetical protein [Nanoarchaeota archaeon]